MRKRITITIDPKVLEKVTELAEAERRSLSSMIEVILSKSIKPPKKPAK